MAKQKTLKGFKPLAKGLEYQGKFPKGAKFVYFEPKKDGIRGVAINGKMYSRTGVRVVNAPIIEKHFALYPNIAKKFVFDGEYFYQNCQKTLGIVKTQTEDHKDRDKLTFHVFDMISKKEYDKMECKTSLKRRKVNIELFFSKLTYKLKAKSAAIQKMTYLTIKPEDKEVQKHFKVALGFGHEGAMIKDPESFYSFRKNRDWQKLKPFRESDMQIVAAKEGKGKHKGRLGGCTYKGVIDGKKIKTDCGGGLTDEQRIKFWAMHKKGKLIGKIVELKHEGVTVKNAIRFPSIIRLHPDKN